MMVQEIMVESTDDLREWLEQNYDSTESAWVVTWKKDSGQPYVSWDDWVDVCICYGWIDNLARKLDDKRTMRRISPRNPKSYWSGINKERVEKLTAAGLMHPQGLKMVEIAKENGTWDFSEGPENLVIPPDLEAELKSYPKADYYFDRFPPSSKITILFWIKMAKTKATRQKRIRETAEKAAQNIKANHPKGREAGPSE